MVMLGGAVLARKNGGAGLRGLQGREKNRGAKKKLQKTFVRNGRDQTERSESHWTSLQFASTVATRGTGADRPTKNAPWQNPGRSGLRKVCAWGSCARPQSRRGKCGPDNPGFSHWGKRTPFEIDGALGASCGARGELPWSAVRKTGWEISLEASTGPRGLPVWRWREKWLNG